MLAYPKISRRRLSTCDVRIQSVVVEAAELVDILVLCGHRTEAEQNAAYRGGFSRLRYPQSGHNRYPSCCVDLAPVEILDSGRVALDWNDYGAFHSLALVVKKTAKSLGVPVEWGGDWRTFVDAPHYQLPKRIWPGSKSLAVASSTCRTPRPVLRLGSRGPAVALLQTLLRLEVDEIFGQKTYAAVRQFQENNALTVDGVVGANTWDALLEEKK